jgi:DNA uptake protein ComE-like DNA-binding protein
MRHFRLNGEVLLTALIAISASLFLGGCDGRSKTTEQQDKEIRQKSAEATATIKEGAKETAKETKKAADDAGRKLTAVAEGVKDGLQSSSGRMDVNAASMESLTTLPGISEPKARQIVKARPYGSTHDLVAKGILSESQYERISTKITAK